MSPIFVFLLIVPLLFRIEATLSCLRPDCNTENLPYFPRETGFNRAGAALDIRIKETPMTNPLLSEWTTPFAIAPFETITDEDFAPALEQALADHRGEIDAIAGAAEPASFTNTIEALEAAGEALDKVLSVFFTVAGADSNPAREELQRAFSPKLAAHYSEISSNKALFGRVAELWERRDTLDLTDEQARVLMLTHRGFVRSGAALSGAQDTRMKEIKGRLATLGTSFTQNLLADERDWFVELGENDLDGLPDFARAAMYEAGREKGVEGPVITLSRSLIVPFLQFSDRRDLREMAYRAWSARGANGGATDNRDIAAEILTLRNERAALLGYDCFADYKLETEMAGSPARVRELLMAVWGPARARAEADAAVLTEMMQADGINGPLEPWDWRYYAEKRRKAEHDLDEAALKPYLQLDRMIEAAFACANRLFGLEFAPLDIPLYHRDCRAWEVTRNGEHVAVFIGDYFARGSKRSGAWCSAKRSQAKFPRPQAPVVINVCNFAKGDPALLSYDDARTLFHEFGHALHQMLSNVTYESVSGTSVARDFVELPSQLYEHWLEVPEVLSEFATHAETGAPMPQEMLEKVLKAANFDQGFQTVEYVASALVDLDFHEGTPPSDPMARQQELLAELGMPAAIGMRHATPHFAHVFSGDGYSSGYYSYMWSEVMDADAFAAFEEAGNAFDTDRARALEENILSTGGSRDAVELYVAFRGRLPGVEALLKGRGLAA
jgi:peptidyl-dipeptidase Dcp